MRTVVLVLICLLMTVSAVAQQRGMSDPLSGTWTGDWGPSPNDRNPVTLQLKWDGKALSGTINPGPDAVQLQKATFDPKTGTIRFEAEAKNRRGELVHYTIDGKVEQNTMSGSWSHPRRKGDFKLTRK